MLFHVFFTYVSLKDLLIMRNASKEKTSRALTNEQEQEITAIEFVSIGLACHALCLIDHAGILKKMDEMGVFNERQIFEFNNPHLIRSALITLVGAKILQLKDHGYTLSKLGKQLAKNIGLITVPLNGYRKLFSKQFQLLQNPVIKDSDIDFGALALASIDFGVSDLDPLLLNLFGAIKPRGTICDLGCGTGERLVKICKTLNSPGLGIEKSDQAIVQGKKYTRDYSKVEIVKGDITDLKDVWEDVEIVTMSFVCHDINSFNKCSQMLHSFQNNFPRMQYLILVDIVSLSEKVPSIMPGFDYVHGLQGITPRTYEETCEVFKKAKYAISQEIPVPNMPNTFVWILKPTKSGK